MEHFSMHETESMKRYLPVSIVWKSDLCREWVYVVFDNWWKTSVHKSWNCADTWSYGKLNAKIDTCGPTRDKYTSNQPFTVIPYIGDFLFMFLWKVVQICYNAILTHIWKQDQCKIIQGLQTSFMVFMRLCLDSSWSLKLIFRDFISFCRSLSRPEYSSCITLVTTTPSALSSETLFWCS